MVGLQPSGLVGEQGVGGRVRFVEAVARELLHQVEDMRRLRLGHATVFGTIDEHAALLGHLLGLLLAHGAAQQVGSAERIAGEHLCDLHDLFLI